MSGQLVLADVGDAVVWCVWVLAAFACLGSGVAVVTLHNPFFSALALIGNLGSLAVLYLLLNAEFVAAAQVLVYAGAVMVMFLFVIAYIGREAGAPWAGGPTWQTVGAILAAGAILVEIVVVIGMTAGGQLAAASRLPDDFGSAGDVGRVFLTNHLLAFEITSIVLLVAAVGGVVLGSHARQVDPFAQTGVGSTEPDSERPGGSAGGSRGNEQVDAGHTDERDPEKVRAGA